MLVQTRSELTGVDTEDGKVLWSQKIPAFRGMNILTPQVYEDGVFTSSYGGRSFMYTVNNVSGKLSISEKWTNKQQGYMSSPVVVNGHAYLHLRNQRFTCIDMKTGQERWTTRPYGKYWSMAFQGDRILALDERGDLMLIRANPEKFDLIDSRHISDESTWAHLAVCDGRVIIRELYGLAVYQWGAAKE